MKDDTDDGLQDYDADPSLDHGDGDDDDIKESFSCSEHAYSSGKNVTKILFILKLTAVWFMFQFSSISLLNICSHYYKTNTYNV